MPRAISDPIQEPPGLLDRLRIALDTAKPPARSLLAARVEAALAEVPIAEAALCRAEAPRQEQASNRLLTAQEAAAMLNVPVRWVHRHTKRLPHRRLGRYVRFPEKTLREWIETRARRLG